MTTIAALLPYLLAFIKSALPGLATGVFVDVFGSFRSNRSRNAAVSLRETIAGLFDRDEDGAAHPPADRSAQPANPKPLPQLSELGLDSDALERLMEGGVTTTRQLHDHLQADSLLTVPGIGPATKARIIKSVQRYNRNRKAA